MMTHTVKAGDTLSSIAQKYGVSVLAIKTANTFIKNINLIQVGWVLDIPEPSSTTNNNTAIVEKLKTVLKDIDNLPSVKELCKLLD